jgi:hypothetical protein
MSTQKTNATLVLGTVFVAGVIVLYAMFGRQTKPTPVESQSEPPVEAQPAADDLVEGADDGVTLIDQTTDTTHSPAGTDDTASPDAAEPVEGETGAPPATLLDAALLGDVEAISALLAGGVDLNASDDGGQTALMAAAGGGHIDAVFALLNAGADAAVRDDARRAARDYALARFDAAGQTIARILGDAVGPPPVSDPSEK